MRTFALVALLAVGSCFPACMTAPAPQRGIDTVEGAALSHNQLRARLLAFSGYAARLVAECGERIALGTQDAEVRRNTLLWRIYACSELQAAGMSTDPVLGLIDAWYVASQMRHLFERGDGVEYFGADQALAAETARRIADEIEALAASVAQPETVDSVRERVEQHVAEHPVENLHLALWTQPADDYMRLLDTKRVGALDAVATMEDRISHLAMALPEMIKISADIARWEAQLVVGDLLGSGTLADALEEFRDISQLAREADELAAHEREAATRDLVAAVDEQRTALLEAVDAQRLLLQELVRAEREIALAEVDRQRLETVALLREERELVVGSLERELDEALDVVPGRVQEGVDAFWKRAVQVGGIAGLVAGLLAFLAARHLVDRARRQDAA